MAASLRESIISIYIILALLTAGFVGMLIFEGVVDDAGVEANTIIVDIGGGGAYVKIQDAIDNASDGDTIQVYAGTYFEDITINKSLTLVGNITGKTMINGSGIGHVILIEAAHWTNVSGFEINGNGSLSFQGIHVYFSNFTNVSSNVCFSASNGIYLYYSFNNTIYDNTCNDNQFNGIFISDSDSNTVDRNVCNSNNFSGISLSDADGNNITHNTCLSNYNSGVIIGDSTSNKVADNNCSYQIHGVGMYRSHYTDIIRNDLYNNSHGVKIEDSDINFISQNRIQLNSATGINLYKNTLDGCQSNIIYYNNIINNTKQAEYHTPDANTWFNGASGGNYWSDYAGADDGSGGRTANDGIGDTALPHAGVDYYPFVKPSGWTELSPPALTDPGEYCKDGCYQLTWTTQTRAAGYIVEEDGTQFFMTPDVIYTGPNASISFTDKPDGMYYYRVKAYDDQLESPWSNIVDMDADKVPGSPSNLHAEEIQGFEVTLRWTPPADHDIEGFHLYMNDTYKGSSGPYFKLLSVPGHYNSVTVTDLVEKTQYHFKVIAYDGFPSTSAESNVCTVTTTDVAPKKPTGLAAEGVSGSEIKLTWTPGTEHDIRGYHIYSTEADGGPEDEYSLVKTLIGNDGEFTAQNLEEEALYYFKIKAYDVALHNSSESDKTYAKTLDETPPYIPTGLHAIRTTMYSITLGWDESQSDDVAGYNLYQAKSESGPFFSRNDEMITKLEYKASDLEEDTKYFFRITAVDDAGQESEFSVIVSGKTLLGPYPPVIASPLEDFSFPEDKTDVSLNLYNCFSDVNNDKLRFWCEGESNLEVVIRLDTGVVELTPKLNWNGDETLTFYAKDDDHDAISDDVKVTISFVNDAPEDVEITKPRDGIEINKGDSITFQGYCKDHDMPYGEILSYTWKSSKMDVLGSGINLTTSDLTSGTHIISLTVTDKKGDYSTATINVKVKEESISLITGDRSGLMILGLGIVIVIVIVVILMFLMVARKRKFEERQKEKERERRAGFVRQPQVAAAPMMAPPLQAPPHPPPEPIHVLHEDEMQEQVAWGETEAEAEAEVETETETDFGGYTRPVPSGIEEGSERGIEEKAVDETETETVEGPGWQAAEEQPYFEEPAAFGGEPEAESREPYGEPQEYYEDYPEEQVEYTDQIDEVITPEQQKEMYDSLLSTPQPPPQPVGYRVVMQPVVQPVYAPHYPQQQPVPPQYPPMQQPIPPPQQQQPPPKPVFCGNCGAQMGNPYQCQHCGWQKQP